MSRRETPRRAMSPWARPANDALTWPFADAHARSDRGETTAGAPRQDIAKRPENDEPMREDDRVRRAAEDWRGPEIRPRTTNEMITP